MSVQFSSVQLRRSVRAFGVVSYRCNVKPDCVITYRVNAVLKVTPGNQECLAPLAHRLVSPIPYTVVSAVPVCQITNFMC